MDGGQIAQVVGVDPQRQKEALTSARMINQLINDDLERRGIKPNQTITDEQFVRRAYLVIAGTIPTAQQAEAFARKSGDVKRVALIDELMGSPAHANHQYNMWADTLRLVDAEDGNNYLSPYREWVKDSLRQNKPYNEFVHAMLSAEGHVWNNPAAGYALRDTGMPLDNLNNSIRIFLGTQIGCAQCHDHPSDRWTQKEFYQLAAFTAGSEYRKNSNPQLPSMLSRYEPKKMPSGGWFYGEVEYNSPEGRVSQGMARANRYYAWENAKAQLRFPKDYAYSNANPNEVVKPAVIFGEMPDMKGKTRRQALADWVTSNDNPRFARTIANRLWHQVFGRGLIEPIDDMRDDTVASNPELMAFLESEIKRVNYNLREFLRILYYTETFQRQVTYDDLPLDQPYYFPGPVLRRMSAEQVWDSLLTLTLDNPHQHKIDFTEQFTQVVSLEDAKDTKDILAKVNAFREYTAMVAKERKKFQYKGQELLPAAELRQPLPDGHFLRQFGQSDREQIDTNSTEGTVPQLLAMFNGFVTHMMLEEGSVIYNRVLAKRNVQDQIDVLFWSLLSRKPTAKERELAAREIAQQGPTGFGNVIWALLNTREFLFVQ
ncbi:DUF1549 and DUF1553 domain-containing protein [Planctomicrobium sp. SH664]|uniref:DUF1549 and DUF1553 domain-containing protein n=1 Tax=Planctomicrobium sp. SH664 TaxID=3448125 RepID=UPI003F5BBAF9